MRMEGEAVAVCPGVEWSVGLKRAGLGHFCGHLTTTDCSSSSSSSSREQQQQHHHHHHPPSYNHPHHNHHHHTRENEYDLERLRKGEESCSHRREEAEDISEEVEGTDLPPASDSSLPTRGLPPCCSDVLKQSQLATMACPCRFTVGYALTTKKTKSFLQPTLETLARSKGIVFLAIDRNRPLEEQGPFDVILHKISNEVWHQQLKAYKQNHPEVLILDPPESIKKVFNRQSMLQEVAALNFRHPGGKVCIPNQLVVHGDPLSIGDRVAKAGLKLPLVAKPLLVDGTAKSHALSLAFSKACLSELNPPLVLQEFVNHGGVLFKVYIVGHIVKVARRFSLPDICEGEPGKSGIIPFPRVSCAAASADGADLDPRVGELPPKDMLDSLCRELRHRLGLSLFNLDMIREVGKNNHYYVIDINYFPGYGKMPDYEKVFTDYLVSLAKEKRK